MSSCRVWSPCAVLVALASFPPPVSPAAAPSPASGNPQSAIRDPQPAAAEPPAIPIRFSLAEPAFVTLVIDDANGVRVRNLLSEMTFLAGQHVVGWDGLDDLGRDVESARHAIYNIPGKLVRPGAYTVRGLVRPKLEILYEMTPYTEGQPAWKTASTSSEWLANHTPPQAVLFVPDGAAPPREMPSPGGQVLVGSYVSEGGSGLAWLNLDGRKLHGQMWIGGVWTGASHLTRDEGARPVSGVYAYTGAWWKGDKYNDNQEELRLYELLRADQKGKAPGDRRFGHGEDRAVLKPTYKITELGPEEARQRPGLGGLAVRNGVLVASIPKLNKVLFINAAARHAVGTAALDDPRGLAFERDGALLALSGRRLLRFRLPEALRAATSQPAEPAGQPGGAVTLGQGEVVVAAGLDDPQQIALDAAGSIFLSDRGDSQQVKVFGSDGKLLRAIGKAGKPAIGPYDPARMSSPMGLTIDGRGDLWVAECDEYPKRLSVWGPDGKLRRAFYGPAQYGGGGWLDPLDKSRFFYEGMELKLDWQTGKSWPVAVFYRPDVNAFRAGRSGPPQTPIHVAGRTYLTNCYTSNPTNGSSDAMIWLLRDGVAVPVAAVGRPGEWKVFEAVPPFSVRWKGQVLPEFSETCTFTFRAASGARLWVGGQRVVDNWNNQSGKERGTIDLEGGKRYDIVLECRHATGPASVSLTWQSPSQKAASIPAERLFPTADAKAPGGLTGEYFADEALKDSKLTRVDPAIRFNWTEQGPLDAQPNAFRAAMPRDDKGKVRVPELFAWSDRGGDGAMQPEEITFGQTDSGAATCVMPDLSVVTSTGLRLKAEGFTAAGAPLYDAAKAAVLATGTQRPTSSGGNQALYTDDGWLVLTVAPRPFAPEGPGGVYKGKPLWSYPSLWPGLHASHIAPVPDRPGELIGTTRLLGPPIRPVGSDIGGVWAVNGNKGTVYLMTMDGLFVATLFRDSRRASWAFPKAERGMSVAEASLHEENFWPSMTQTADGAIYLSVGHGLVRLEGLEKARRLPEQRLTVTGEQLLAAQRQAGREALARHAGKAGEKKLTVAVLGAPPAVDGALEEWAKADWALIDERDTQVGDWGRRKVKTQAALAVAAGRLFVALRADDPSLLRNSGQSPIHLFKTGGALDLMVGADPKADPARVKPVAGDQRLLIASLRDAKGKESTIAMHYRPAVAGTAEPVVFASPVRSLAIDRVDDVSDRVQLAMRTVEEEGGKVRKLELEASVPLELLGLKAEPGTVLRGDVGVLRGNGFQTMHRIYWSNKAQQITSDSPSEAELLPRLWGTWEFRAAAPPGR